jgi:hypothetical protein
MRFLKEAGADPPPRGKDRGDRRLREILRSHWAADGPLTDAVEGGTWGPAILYITRRFIDEIVQTILSDQVICIAKQLKTSE